jgi:hypothetical protein
MLTGELTTALSDVVLAVAAAVLAWRARGDEDRWLSAAFWSACVSASAGALFHGFRHVALALLLLGVWKLVLVGLAATSALLLASALRRAAVAPWAARLVWWGMLAKLGATLAWATRSNSVTVAGVDFVLTLVAIAALEWHRRAVDAHARWSLAAVVVTLLALVLQASGFRYGQPFCHNDAFHLLQAGALVGFFVGLRRRPEATAAIQ